MDYTYRIFDLIDNGNIPELYKEFESFLKNDDNELLFEVAELLYERGFIDMAKKAYKILLVRNYNVDECYVYLADIDIDQGDDDEALYFLSLISSSSPLYVKSLMVSADLYQTMGMFDVSEQKLLRAYKISYNNDIIQFALAELYFYTEQYKKAINMYIILIKKGILELSNVNIVQRLGISYEKIGHFKQALGYLQQIPKNKRNIDTHFNLGVIQFNLGMIDESIKELELVKKTSSDYSAVYLLLSDSYKKKNQLIKALNILQDGIKMDPFNINFYINASKLSFKLKNLEQSLDYLKIALKEDPDNLLIIKEMSKLLLINKKYQDNILLINKYLKNFQEDPILYWLRGQSYWKIDDFDNALNDYKLALNYLSNSAIFLRDASQFFKSAGYLSVALECINNYLRLNHDDLEMIDLENELLDELNR